MKLRTRISLLSAGTALAALAAMGAMSLELGRRSIVGAEVESLAREAWRYELALDSDWRAMRDIDSASASVVRSTAGIEARLRDFLRGREFGLRASGAELELRSPGGGLYYASGELIKVAGEGDRPEVVAAAVRGPSYLLRRVGPERRLALYYAAPFSLGGLDLVLVLASDSSAVDLFGARQLLLLRASSSLAAVLLVGASFVLGGAMSRRLEELARRATLLAGGDYGVRAPEGGGDEVASLASSFNRMAESIAEEVRRLQEEKDGRQAFVDDLTHELRTPVTSIVGFASLLRSRSWDEELFADCLSRIESEGRRILSLTEGLKRLLVARTASRDFVRLEARPFLEQLAAEAGPAARAADIGLRASAEDGGALCDRDLLAMALRNLLDNAIRASPASTEIELGFRKEVGADGRRALGRFYVRDHGPGMSEEEIARAGTPFHRKAGGPGASGGKGGFGLGLAICDEIARSLGAELRLERPADGGLLASIVFENLPAVYEGDSGT